MLPRPLGALEKASFGTGLNVGLWTGPSLWDSTRTPGLTLFTRGLLARPVSCCWSAV